MSRPSTPTTVRRTSVTLGADQVVSSASNFLTTLAVASIIEPAEFGAYALGGGLFALALAAARMTSSERMMLGANRSNRVSLSTDTMLVIVAVSTTASFVLWRVVGEAAVLAWTASALPILAQDRVRFVALLKRPGAAIAGDALWVGLVVAVWVAVDVGPLGVGWAPVLITALPPFASFAAIAFLVRNDVVMRIERDLARSRAELHFVFDPWIQAGAVFAALGIAAAFGSLEIVGRARALMLLFQPFVSISYVGRLLVLGSTDARRIGRWPAMAACACAIYSAVVGLAALLIRQTGREVDEIWLFSAAAFVLMAVAQCARAFHQSVADLLRRSVAGKLIRARLVFAALLVVIVGPLVVWGDLTGLTCAWAAAYLAGAAAIRSAAGSGLRSPLLSNVDAADPASTPARIRRGG